MFWHSDGPWPYSFSPCLQGMGIRRADLFPSLRLHEKYFSISSMDDNFSMSLSGTFLPVAASNSRRRLNLSRLSIPSDFSVASPAVVLGSSWKPSSNLLIIVMICSFVNKCPSLVISKGLLFPRKGPPQTRISGHASDSLQILFFPTTAEWKMKLCCPCRSCL